MKNVRLKLPLIMFAAFVITGIICITQRMQIGRLKERQNHLAAQHQELLTNYTRLMAVDEEKNVEIARLRSETSEILSLRSQVAQSRGQLAAVAPTNKATNETASSNDFAGYVKKEDMRFVGFDSPENALQSMRWAVMTGDYTSWLAALAPRLQAEELAKSESRGMFQHDSALTMKFRGMQVLATKPVGGDRVELKVRIDTENSVTILVVPMVAVGNEWRLGDEIQPYTEAWDRPGDAQ